MKQTDETYRAWIRTQESCLGGYSEYVHGEGRCIAAHVARAKNGGIATKAEFSCVPLTQEQHLHQHQHGEAACLERYLGGGWTPVEAKTWFDEQVEHYRNLCEQSYISR